MNVMRILFAAAMAAVLMPLPGATVPRPAPAFTYQVAGGQGSFAQYKGKVVIAEFVLTTCPHCQNVARELSKLQAEFGARGLQIVCVAINDNAGGLALQFQKDFAPNLPIGYGRGINVGARGFLQISEMQSMMMPQLVVIDRAGTIVRQVPGEDPLLGASMQQNLRKLVMDALGPAKPVGPAKPATTKPSTTKPSTVKPSTVKPSTKK
jgi:thiol-disulfide isomerase/thioredoxin